MTEKTRKIDFAYELLISTTNELGIKFEEEMVDEVFCNIDKMYSIEEIESPINNEFVMEFSQSLHKWTNIKKQFIK